MGQSPTVVYECTPTTTHGLWSGSRIVAIRVRSGHLVVYDRAPMPQLLASSDIEGAERIRCRVSWEEAYHAPVGNTLYWLLRHLPASHGVGFESDTEVCRLARHNRDCGTTMSFTVNVVSECRHPCLRECILQLGDPHRPGGGPHGVVLRVAGQHREMSHFSYPAALACDPCLLGSGQERA